jgi:hypothetical protein
MLIHDMPLHDVKIGVWCAMSATTITGPLFHTINIHRYVFDCLSDYDRTFSFFQEQSQTYRTAKNTALRLKCFWWQNDTKGFWPPHSSEMNPLDCYL